MQVEPCAGVSALFIADEGNIGVENTVPIAKLEVSGNVKVGSTASAQTAVFLATDIRKSISI
jgi:hypothetical protein